MRSTESYKGAPPVTTPTARYVDEVLVDWYSSVARWNAPGRAGDSMCKLCVQSPFASQLGLSAWPHDVTHPLVQRLTGTMATPTDLEAMQHALDRRHSDILDVLEHCVSDQLARYLRAQTELVVVEFERDRSTLE